MPRVAYAPEAAIHAVIATDHILLEIFTAARSALDDAPANIWASTCTSTNCLSEPS